MDSHCVLLAVLLLFCSAGASDSPWKAVRVGDAVTFPVVPPKGQRLTNILLRDSSRQQAVAIWMDSKEITVVDIKYAGRVTFQMDEMAFRIANLSLDDGGKYETSTGFTSSSPVLLGSFLVAVFNVTQRISPLKNDSCLIYLDCEAGMGPGHRVTYAWKDTKAGTTLSREARLTQLVHTDQQRDYACVAQSSAGQSTLSFVLQHPCVPSAASPGPWALGSLLVMAALLLLLL
ncbi:SLAM family member 5-like [Thamnophis elegans]|uniref:SLAM family member 5-like n=1 Tax=Thamnophis elegans TaxID=35005 RepID=UPI0013791127|nr:SLAM family member 5-like [Thamnophis elegans]